MRKLSIASVAKSGTAAKISSGLIPPVFVQWNMNFFGNKIRHFLKLEQLSSTIYTARLDRKFFTNPGQENTLLYYYEDLKYLDEPLNAEMVNHNLNSCCPYSQD